MRKLLLIVAVLLCADAFAQNNNGWVISGGGSAITDTTCTNQVFTAFATPNFTCSTVLPAWMDLTQAYAFSSTSNTFVGTSYTDGSADPADSGVLRCGNNVACIAAEASPASTDGTILFNTSEEWDMSTGSTGIIAPAGSASIASYGQTGHVNSGLFFSAAGAPQMTVLGNATFAFGASNLNAVSAQAIGWTSSANDPTAAQDTRIARLAAGNITIGNSSSIGSGYASGTKTLTNNTPTTFALITMTSGSNAGGIVHYSIEDTTTRGTIAGDINYAMIDSAGTITCTMGAKIGEAVVGGSAGFALTSITCGDNTGNVGFLKATALTTGGTDTLQIKYTIIQNNTQVVTSQ